MREFTPHLVGARAALAPLVRGDLDDERVRDLSATHVWSCLVEPGDGIAGRLIAAFGAADALSFVLSNETGGQPPAAAEVSPKQWADALARWRPRLDHSEIARALTIAARAGVSLVTPDDERWPTPLNDLGDHAPLLLWVRGDVEALARPSASVALVGARAATSYGEHVATEFSADLAARGVAVISGAAYGIDGAAHRAAVRAGGTTIAFLAGGVEQAYPAGHSQLIDDVVASGAVVSEVPCGSRPTKWRFLQRNRLIAALGAATVVVEAGWRSGSINTAGHAAALGRPLGAVPGPITSAASAGCHRVLREFDARCVTNAGEVMELLGAAPQALFDLPDLSAGGARTDDTTRVRDAMSYRSWRDTPDIARRAGLTTSDVAAILGLFALEGTAERSSEGWRLERPGRVS